MNWKPDLSLPTSIAQSDLTPPGDDVQDFALYALCEISDEDLQAWRWRCMDEDPEASDDDSAFVRPAPKAHFPKQPLSDVIHYHLELARQGYFNPIYFLVCVYPESTTELMVTLDDLTEYFKPDVIWMPVEQCSGDLANLGLGHISWAETKEGDRGRPFWPGESALEPEPPRTWENVQVYAVEEVAMEELAKAIQPDGHWEIDDLNKPLCNIKRITTPMSDNPGRCAANIHPVSCAERPATLKKYFIVADTPNFIQEGVQIVSLDWDGVLTDRTRDQLLQIGSAASLRVQRGSASWGTANNALHRITRLFEEEDVPRLGQIHRFAVYSRRITQSWKVEVAIDPIMERRSPERVRTCWVGIVESDDLDSPDRFWPALTQTHMEFCRREHFEPNLARQYFIWNGNKEPTKESMLGLIKISWDGSLEAGVDDRLLENWKTAITRREAVAIEAHGILSDVVDGKQMWNGIAIDD